MAFSITASVTEGLPPQAPGRMPQFIQFRCNGVDLGGPDATVVEFVGDGTPAARGTGVDADKITVQVS